MKRIKVFLSLSCLLFVCLPLWAQAPDWGEADTLAHHTLGPGIHYTKIYFKGKKMLIWVTKVDLTNPYNKIEQVQSRHQVPDLLRWTVQQHFIQNSRPGHNVRVAFNHDFFSYEGGTCIGLNISDGEIPFGGGWGRSLIAINEDKKAAVFNPSLDAKIIFPDNSTLRINHFNSQADSPVGNSGDCILLNRFNSRTLTEAGKYIKILPKGKWVVNGADIPCEVLAISDTPLQSTQSEYIIYLKGSQLHAADGKIQVGDEIRVSQKMNTGSFGAPLSNILNAFHGYPSIAFEGKLHEGEYNNFENGREYEISSRVMVGMSQDGNTLYVVTTEMSSKSAGVDCIDITNYMLATGSWNVVNFDSGGSVAIVVDEEMLNYPARDAVRPVVDALLAVSLAPEATEVASYSFLIPSIRPSIASSTPLTLLSFNEYEEVLEKDVRGFTFTCVPETLGSVDENQVFHTGVQVGEGVIIAEKNGKSTRIKVSIRPVEQIEINPNNILIDRTRAYPINIETLVENTVFKINPDVLTWEVTDPTVCAVENGILRGLQNGETTVNGTFGNLTKAMNVKVEIGKGKQVANSFEDMTDVTIKSAGANNISFSGANFPAEWEHGSMMNFNFTAGRSPFIELTKNVVFYGLPDSFLWKFRNQDEIIKEVQFYLEDAQQTQTTLRLFQQTAGDQTLFVPLATSGTPWGVAKFPITLKRIKLMLNVDAPVKGYVIPVSGLYAFYPESPGTNIPVITKNKYDVRVYYSGSELFINYVLDTPGEVSAQLYSVDGQIHESLIRQYCETGNYHNKINVSGIPNGVYIVKMTINGINVSQKVVIDKRH
jgi:hypothetical protein